MIETSGKNMITLAIDRKRHVIKVLICICDVYTTASMEELVTRSYVGVIVDDEQSHYEKGSMYVLSYDEDGFILSERVHISNKRVEFKPNILRIGSSDKYVLTNNNIAKLLKNTEVNEFNIKLHRTCI